MTAALIAYHYAVGGVPLFQENVLLARFDNTSSGLFGLPGRFNLFGAFFALFLVFAYYQSIPNVGRVRGLLVTTTLLLVVSRLFQGNKGAIIQCLVALLIVGPYFEKRYQVGEAIRRIASGIPLWLVGVGGLGATAAFFFVAHIHITQGIGLYDNVFDALVRRVAVVSGSAFYESVMSVAPRYGHGWGGYFLSDLSYFAQSFGSSHNLHHSLNDLVSSSVTGRDVFGDKFLVPVAMNGLGYLYIEFGLLGIVVGGILLGAAMGRLYFKVDSVRQPLLRALLFYTQLCLFWVITRGNFGFYVPNMLLMAVVFCVALLGIALLGSFSTRRRSTFLRLRHTNRTSADERLSSHAFAPTLLRSSTRTYRSDRAGFAAGARRW
jgi:hypothetical protein